MTAAIPLSGGNSISGPHTHKNLTIYLIHGPNQTSRSFLTLQEALERKTAVVYETGSVNELAIENLSGDQEIYVQSGDIVKGGRQDRTFKDDVILPTKSGKVPVQAFCVEHGRWSPRGKEASGHFESSSQAVASRDMKKAVKMSANQAEVWGSVAESQRKLASNVAAPVAAAASPTSYMLSLESGSLQKPVEEYVGALAGLADSRADVIGYAVAVNGKLSSADVYANHELFRKLWPKLLRASAVEAITDLDAKANFQAPDLAAVKAFLEASEKGKASMADVNARTRVVKKDSDQNAVFETQDRAAKQGWLHKSYLAK
jgi:hypothetical protein